MALPVFYSPALEERKDVVELNEENSKHIIQVLRKQAGDQIKLTNGKGAWSVTSIIEAHKKHCIVRVIERGVESQSLPRAAIGISLLKNTNRFEWFLEKATELGINEIFPLICQRTEKEKFRMDRMQGICISAMLQSQQCWLPVLHEPVQFEDVLNLSYQQKFIAHCEVGEKKHLRASNMSSISLIGPEGDFTSDEIASALSAGFIAVSLGTTRLRTETAGMTAAVLMRATID